VQVAQQLRSPGLWEGRGLSDAESLRLPSEAIEAALAATGPPQFGEHAAQAAALLDLTLPPQFRPAAVSLDSSAGPTPTPPVRVGSCTPGVAKAATASALASVAAVLDGRTAVLDFASPLPMAVSGVVPGSPPARSSQLMAVTYASLPWLAPEALVWIEQVRPWPRSLPPESATLLLPCNLLSFSPFSHPTGRCSA
jgi:hypothetical protein